MARKKWTPQPHADKDVVKLREKRKWQLALRRYVLEQQLSSEYARYFGLSSALFREWISSQFTGELTWENFGIQWQFEHLVPSACFDFESEEDLLLCWNFTNIHVGRVANNEPATSRTNLLAARAWFQQLFDTTGLAICKQMIKKLHVLETAAVPAVALIKFIQDNQSDIQLMAGLAATEFADLNRGISLQDVLLEKAILNRFS